MHDRTLLHTFRSHRARSPFAPFHLHKIYFPFKSLTITPANPPSILRIRLSCRPSIFCLYHFLLLTVVRRASDNIQIIKDPRPWLQILASRNSNRRRSDGDLSRRAKGKSMVQRDQPPLLSHVSPGKRVIDQTPPRPSYLLNAFLPLKLAGKRRRMLADDIMLQEHDDTAANRQLFSPRERSRSH